MHLEFILLRFSGLFYILDVLLYPECLIVWLFHYCPFHSLWANLLHWFLLFLPPPTHKPHTHPTHIIHYLYSRFICQIRSWDRSTAWGACRWGRTMRFRLCVDTSRASRYGGGDRGKYYSLKPSFILNYLCGFGSTGIKLIFYLINIVWYQFWNFLTWIRIRLHQFGSTDIMTVKCK